MPIAKSIELFRVVSGSRQTPPSPAPSRRTPDGPTSPNQSRQTSRIVRPYALPVFRSTTRGQHHQRVLTLNAQFPTSRLLKNAAHRHRQIDPGVLPAAANTSEGSDLMRARRADDPHVQLPVATHHPLRAVRALGRGAAHDVVAGLYATTGRPSIPPDPDSTQCQRLLMEELVFRVRGQYGRPRHPTTFTKNRAGGRFFDGPDPRAGGWAALGQHFTVDNWKRGRPEERVDAAESDPPDDPGNPTVNFHGERRRNDTHQSDRPRRCCIGRARGKKPNWRIPRQSRGAPPTSRPTRRGPQRDAAALLLEARARWGGQGLRCGELRCRRACPSRHAPRGAEGALERDQSRRGTRATT